MGDVNVVAEHRNRFLRVGAGKYEDGGDRKIIVVVGNDNIISPATPLGDFGYLCQIFIKIIFFFFK